MSHAWICDIFLYVFPQKSTISLKVLLLPCSHIILQVVNWTTLILQHDRICNSIFSLFNSFPFKYSPLSILSLDVSSIFLMSAFLILFLQSEFAMLNPMSPSESIVLSILSDQTTVILVWDMEKYKFKWYRWCYCYVFSWQMWRIYTLQLKAWEVNCRTHFGIHPQEGKPTYSHFKSLFVKSSYATNIMWEERED